LTFHHIRRLNNSAFGRSNMLTFSTLKFFDVFYVFDVKRFTIFDVFLRFNVLTFSQFDVFDVSAVSTFFVQKVPARIKSKMAG
jgi:hypothetical protein